MSGSTLLFLQQKEGLHSCGPFRFRVLTKLLLNRRRRNESVRKRRGRRPDPSTPDATRDSARTISDSNALAAVAPCKQTRWPIYLVLFAIGPIRISGLRMDNHEAQWLWWDFAHITGGAILRAKAVENDHARIDWERQTQAVRTAGLGFACSLLELRELDRVDDHSNLLFDLRNAVLHNGGDITQNRGAPRPFNNCRSYIDNEKWLELDPENKFGLSRSFSMSTDGRITFGPALFELVTRIFRNYLTEEELARPAP